MKDYFMISETGRIHNAIELKASVRAGEHTFPGSYRLAFVVADGEYLSFDTVKENFSLVLDAVKNPGTDTQWQVIGLEIVDHIDDTVYCAHSNEQLNNCRISEIPCCDQCARVVATGDDTELLDDDGEIATKIDATLGAMLAERKPGAYVLESIIEDNGNTGYLDCPFCDDIHLGSKSIKIFENEKSEIAQ